MTDSPERDAAGSTPANPAQLDKPDKNKSALIWVKGLWSTGRTNAKALLVKAWRRCREFLPTLIPVFRTASAGALVVGILLATKPALISIGTYIWALPKSQNVAITVVLIACLLLLYKGKGTMADIREWSLNATLARVIAFTCLTALTLFSTLMLTAWWLIGAPPPESLPAELTLANAEKLLIRVAWLIGGLTVVSTLVIGYRKQHNAEEETKISKSQEERAQRQTWTDNFSTAVEMISEGNTARRGAGAQLMASLVETAPEDSQAQVAIDVLCGLAIAKGEDGDLKTKVIREIRKWLIQSKRWQGLDFNFSGGHFSDFNLSQATLRGIVSFRGAVFQGSNNLFRDVHFEGTVDFSECTLRGAAVDFRDSHFKSGHVQFNRMTVEDSEVDFNGSEFTGARVKFHNARFANSTVGFRRCAFLKNSLDFTLAEFENSDFRFESSSFNEGGGFRFHQAKFQECKLYFSPIFYVDGILDFLNAKIGNSYLNFSGSSFQGGSALFMLKEAYKFEANFYWCTFNGINIGFHAEFLESSIRFQYFSLLDGSIDFTNSVLGSTNVSFEKVKQLKKAGAVSFKKVTGDRPTGLTLIKDNITHAGEWGPPEGTTSAS